MMVIMKVWDIFHLLLKMALDVALQLAKFNPIKKRNNLKHKSTY